MFHITYEAFDQYDSSKSSDYQLIHNGIPYLQTTLYIMSL